MIELKHLSKTFETAGGRVDALKDVSLTIPDGDVYGIIGMSGAGKSTLVRCINMLERPTEGEVIVNGQRLDTMTPAQLRAARREITMIFQRFNLLMQRNCLANVCFPMELSGLRGEKKWREQRALELLDIVGVDALKDVSLTIPDGDVYGIIGMSGAGKSTLVRCINMLERPTEGEVIVNGQRLDTMTPAQLRAARREITMIFQRFNLLMQRNCLANVCFPMELSGLRGEKKWREQRALELLDIVGLKDKAKAYPAQLSGGQQQRVAIARALATNPKVLLCDEATSALDPKTTRQILELIGDINKKLGITVVIITHQMSVVKEVCNHVAILDDGEVVEEGLVSTVFSAPKSAAARHLVFPRGADIDVSDPQQQRRIRLIFRSAKTTSIPLVARLATDEGISATVISANTQKLSEEVYGSMLLGVPNAQFEQAMDFLRSIENLQVEEASVDVQ